MEKKKKKTRKLGDPIGNCCLSLGERKIISVKIMDRGRVITEKTGRLEAPSRN